MQSRRRVLSRFLTGLVAATCVAAAGCGDDDESPAPPATGGGAGAGAAQKLVILHTNDLHSHLQGFGPEQDYTPLDVDDDETVGGAARLAAAIGAARAQAAKDETPVLLLDAGDFMMGTLFELLGTQAAPELSLLQALDYDAVTLGNHEFDWTPRGLAGILAAAT